MRGDKIGVLMGSGGTSQVATTSISDFLAESETAICEIKSIVEQIQGKLQGVLGSKDIPREQPSGITGRVRTLRNDLVELHTQLIEVNAVV